MTEHDDEMTVVSDVDNIELQLKEYQFLEQITKAIDDTEGLISVMEIVKDYFTDIFSFDHLTIFVLLANNKYAVIHDVVAQDDIKCYAAGSLMPITGTGIEYVLQNNKTHYNSDAQTFHQFMDDEELAHDGTRALIRVPLAHDGATFAVMAMNSIRPNHFIPSQVALMEKVARRLSVSAYSLRLTYALQNALYTDRHTGLLNRAFLNDMMMSYQHGIIETIVGFKVPDSPEVSLLLVQISRFKDFIEKFGQAEADERFAQVTELLIGVVQDLGFLIRYTDEELLIVLPGVLALDIDRLENETKLRVLNLNSMRGPAVSKMSLRLTLRKATGDWTNVSELLKSVVEPVD